VLIILHAVGLAGLHSPWSSFFLLLTPVNLVVSFLIMLRGWQKITKRLWLAFTAVFCIGWFVEYLGSAHGLIFGNYIYGEVLGPKLVGVPLVIGVNWLLVIFGAHALVSSFGLPSGLRILLGAACSVVLDLAIEPVAVRLGFWTWANDEIPLSNYMGWFGVSALLIWMIESLIGPTENRVARSLFLVLFAFFGLMAVL